MNFLDQVKVIKKPTFTNPPILYGVKSQNDPKFQEINKVIKREEDNNFMRDINSLKKSIIRSPPNFLN